MAGFEPNEGINWVQHIYAEPTATSCGGSQIGLKGSQEDPKRSVGGDK